MSFTYNTPWAGTRDYVRFKIQDTISATAFFQDEELDGLIAQEGGDGNIAAASALEALAIQYSRGAISWGTPGLNVNRQQIYKAILESAAALRKAALDPFEFESVLDQFVDSAGVDRTNYTDSPLSGLTGPV